MSIAFFIYPQGFLQYSKLSGEVGSLGFDGERVIGPARVYLKPYSKARASYFEEEG